MVSGGFTTDAAGGGGRKGRFVALATDPELRTAAGGDGLVVALVTGAAGELGCRGSGGSGHSWRAWL